ncbi:hypothetical protein QVL76_26805, partial [Klebsiella pneumoniae]|nr:hypothetical protein [Klebsiella pneumoniae]
MLLQPQQRTITIFGRRTVRRGAKTVIEDLQRPGAAVATAGDLLGKRLQRQLPLSGKAAEVA